MKLALWPHGRTRRADTLSSLLETILDAPSASHLPEIFQSGLSPAVNIAEDEHVLTVSVEMPGLDEQDIDVQVLGNQLLIKAERKFEAEKKEKEYHRVEHQYGSFTRSITLPNGLRTDDVTAKYSKGILNLDFPKVEPTPSSKIKVKSDD